VTIARLLAYRRILLSLITMIEDDLRARGWRHEQSAHATTQDRRSA
jgi:hypothetical protein